MIKKFLKHLASILTFIVTMKVGWELITFLFIACGIFWVSLYPKETLNKILKR